ncbi:MAG: amidohydrolase family protein [Actinomycetota bacterium]
MPLYERPDWIPRRVEAPIDPGRRIVDAHHHLWDRTSSRYLAEELLADAAAGHNVTHTVFVECSADYDENAPRELAPVGETRFVVEQARRAETIGGAQIGAIVSHADLTLGSQVADVLLAHDAAGAGLFRGVRHGTNWSPHDAIKNGHHDPRPSQMAEDEFRLGVAMLGQHGFSYDAWLYFDQLSELAALARAVPETSIVLNHLGGPLGTGPHAGSGRGEMLGVWRTGIAEVATCDNVVCKVGGIGMEHYYGMGWYDLPEPPSSETVADWWGDMVHVVIDAFGPDRCLFESNYPVDRQTLPYTVLWNAFQTIADRYSDREQDALFFDTAARVYRIEV